MHRILIISKDGTETMHYTRVQTANELYRPAGVRVSPSFCQCAAWPVNCAGDTTTELRIYGKIEGPERYKNVYVCPPPFAHINLFGTCIVAQVEVGDSNKLCDIDIDLWKNLCNGSSIIVKMPETHTTPKKSRAAAEPTSIPTPAESSIVLNPTVAPPAIIDTYLNCAIELNYEPYLPDV